MSSDPTQSVLKTVDGGHGLFAREPGTTEPPADRQPEPVRDGPTRAYFVRIHTQTTDDPRPAWSGWEQVTGADEHAVARRYYDQLAGGEWVQFGVQVAIAVRGGTVVHLSSGAASNG